MILLERNIRIYISDDVVLALLHSFEASIEGMDFLRKAAVFSLRHLHKLHPAMCWKISLYDIAGIISRPIVHDNPFDRQDCLLDH